MKGAVSTRMHYWILSVHEGPKRPTLSLQTHMQGNVLFLCQGLIFFFWIIFTNNVLTKFATSCNRILWATVKCVFTKTSSINFSFSNLHSLIKKTCILMKLFVPFKLKSVWQGPVQSAEAGRSPLKDLGGKNWKEGNSKSKLSLTAYRHIQELGRWLVVCSS